MRRCALLAVLALCSAMPAHARDLKPDQLGYVRHAYAAGVTVQADWVEPDGTPRQLSFRLPAAALAEPALRLVPPSQEQVQSLGLAAATAEAARAPQGVRLQLRPVPGGVDVKASGPAGANIAAPLQRVMQEYRRAADQAVSESGYRFRTPILIEPDYRRLVAAQSVLLADTARDIARQTASLGPRERLQFLVSFLQSVPYLTLQTRGVTALRTPAGVLADDLGDCDAKSVTLATLLAVTNPDLATVLIYDDAHAFLGVALPPQPGDVSFRAGGNIYVAIEPVGPGWFPVGTLDEQSRRILQSGTAHVVALRD
jgi:hypothetical protein